ncbi:alpha/beta fold hydrolase [Nocardioides nitrophenolicus]|uniref:alpha/beta fold hydrolase n=1 Tax=Nocardioides nitrophenolicus TaxID=60489 RepID=UPI00195DE2AB|nr:alpha/beta hydrolase [Nocardioides nitrophenolicus]MBM7515599.1 pimeloyl-ACP methyl ester carboxylesterase [Nocardioides nitrophenolicus]
MVELTCTQLTGAERGADAERVLVVGPSLGTGVADLWSRCAALLPATWQVVGWDLPGHGAGAPTTSAFTVADLAAAVRDRAAGIAAGRPVAYAGVSLGGAVGFTIAVEPGPFDAVVTLASAPRIGTPEGWHERAAYVRAAGTAAMVEGSAARWFAPGFLERDPATGSGLLLALQSVDDESYALACEALATYDVRDRIAFAPVPLLVAGGAHDVVVTPDQVEVVLDDVAHLPPAEDPAATAALITRFLETDR